MYTVTTFLTDLTTHVLLKHRLLNRRLDIGRHVLRLAAIDEIAYDVLRQGYLLPRLRTILPATTEMGLVNHLHILWLDYGTPHLAVPTILVGVFAIFMRQQHNFTVCVQDFATGVLAISTVVLERCVA